MHGKDIIEHKANNLFQYLNLFLSTTVNNSLVNSTHLQLEKHRTAFIDALKISTVEIKLTSEERAKLVKSGQKGMIELLERNNESCNSSKLASFSIFNTKNAEPKKAKAKGEQKAQSIEKELYCSIM